MGAGRIGWATRALAALAFIVSNPALPSGAPASPAAPAAVRGNAVRGNGVPQGMALIPSGSFVPLYSVAPRAPGEPAAAIPVPAFALDVLPVTNRQFLAFVRAEPRWQRSRVKRIFAEPQYLSHWAGDEALGDASPADSPVTQVSWFAARAYCRAQGKTLPTTAQWEYAAGASASAPDGASDEAFQRLIAELYSRPNPAVQPPVGRGVRNVWGVQDLHGLVWAWTSDFNTALVTGESRGDSALERDLFCGAGAANASSFKNYPAFLRYGLRSSLSARYTVGNLGFRCAAEVP
jgi:formylglycine-generating enzyme required for sulfatase activity